MISMPCLYTCISLSLYIYISSMYVQQFRYTTELYWLIAYFLLLPIIFVDLCLFFGVPILISILMPIQRELKVWQSPTTWDYSAYIVCICTTARQNCYNLTALFFNISVDSMVGWWLIQGLCQGLR